MKQESAEQLGLEAKKNDVQLSLHGSYYVNLAGTKEVVEASKRRLIACATAASWMRATVVAFHLGYYGASGKAKGFKDCVQTLSEVTQALDGLGIRNVNLGPESMGKHVQIGNLEEILTICETVDRTQPVIDWGHLHARTGGRLQNAQDFRAVLIQIENRLGNEAMRNLHCHFSKIEFTKKGERCHHILDDKHFGPKFEPFAAIISEFKMNPVVICETPLLDLDAAKMRDIYFATQNSHINRQITP